MSSDCFEWGQEWRESDGKVEGKLFVAVVIYPRRSHRAAFFHDLESARTWLSRNMGLDDVACPTWANILKYDDVDEPAFVNVFERELTSREIEEVVEQGGEGEVQAEG